MCNKVSDILLWNYLDVLKTHWYHTRISGDSQECVHKSAESVPEYSTVSPLSPVLQLLERILPYLIAWVLFSCKFVTTKETRWTILWSSISLLWDACITHNNTCNHCNTFFFSPDTAVNSNVFTGRGHLHANFTGHLSGVGVTTPLKFPSLFTFAARSPVKHCVRFRHSTAKC